MSSFTEPLFLFPGEDSLWETAREFSYEIGAKGSGLRVTVPKGTETDLATMPRLLWPLVPPHDPRFAAAFVLHDHMCRLPGFSRVITDAVLYEALRVLGASIFRASAVYWAVAIFRTLKGLRR
jgi:hypothetical protein